MVVDDWGVIEYREAWGRQREAVARLQRGDRRYEKGDGIADAHADADASAVDDCERIVVCEHPHVYTLGFHGNEANLIASEERLRALGAECVRIERGGDITYHGPGQVVVYPIIDLRRHRLGVKQYIETLERAVIRLLDEYGIAASSNSEAIGVWLDWETPTARKICAIGVKVSHGVTMHGLALNVNTDLSMFSLINPCGFTDKGVTSMAVEKGMPLDMKLVKSRFAEILVSELSLNYDAV